MIRTVSFPATPVSELDHSRPSLPSGLRGLEQGDDPGICSLSFLNAPYPRIKSVASGLHVLLPAHTLTRARRDDVCRGEPSEAVRTPRIFGYLCLRHMQPLPRDDIATPCLTPRISLADFTIFTHLYARTGTFQGLRRWRQLPKAGVGPSCSLSRRRQIANISAESAPRLSSAASTVSATNAVMGERNRSRVDTATRDTPEKILLHATKRHCTLRNIRRYAS